MNAEEIRVLQERLKALHRRLRREQISVAGLSHSAIRVISAVERAGGATQPAQLAQETQMTSSNVAAALRELESQGLVARRRDEGDARRVNVSLTPEGSALVAHVRGIREAWLARAIDAQLDEAEQRQLMAASELLGRLAAHDDAHALQR